MEYGWVVVGWFVINLVALCFLPKVIIDTEKMHIIFVFWLLVVLVIGIVLILCAPHPEPHYTGEIIKFYANGTVLVDNGTVIPWPYGGR